QVDIWQPYDAAMLDSYQMLGQPVFLDVTAAWCITCKANERVALSGDRFETLVKQQGVQLMKADWTNPSPEVDALIARFDRQGVPLYAYFPGDGGPVQLLPQVLTPGLIERTFSAS
ncbi:MAG: thioredoxin family protein, partial [Saccharospirillum sp.]